MPVSRGAAQDHLCITNLLFNLRDVPYETRSHIQYEAPRLLEAGISLHWLLTPQSYAHTASTKYCYSKFDIGHLLLYGSYGFEHTSLVAESGSHNLIRGFHLLC